jgi:hypothetical protein
MGRQRFADQGTSSVCLDGIFGIRSVGTCDVISRVPRVLVCRARFAEKQDERADDQHGEHQNLELIDDCDDGRLAGDHVVERGEPRPGD